MLEGEGPEWVTVGRERVVCVALMEFLARSLRPSIYSLLAAMCGIVFALSDARAGPDPEFERAFEGLMEANKARGQSLPAPDLDENSEG